MRNWHCLVVLWLIRVGTSHVIKVSTSFHRTNSLIITVHLPFLQSFPRKWLSFKCLSCLLFSHLSIFSISAERVKLLLKVFIFDPQIFDSLILNHQMSDFKLRYFLQLCWGFSVTFLYRLRLEHSKGYYSSSPARCDFAYSAPCWDHPHRIQELIRSSELSELNSPLLEDCWMFLFKASWREIQFNERFS